MLLFALIFTLLSWEVLAQDFRHQRDTLTVVPQHNNLEVETIESNYPLELPGFKLTDHLPQKLNQKQQYMSVEYRYGLIEKKDDQLIFHDVEAGLTWGRKKDPPVYHDPSLPGTGGESDGTENSVNSYLTASFGEGRVLQNYGSVDLVLIGLLHDFYYRGDGSHFMRTNNIEYGMTPELSLGVLWQQGSETFILFSPLVGKTYAFSEREGNISHLNWGWRVLGEVARNFSFEWEERQGGDPVEEGYREERQGEVQWDFYQWQLEEGTLSLSLKGNYFEREVTHEENKRLRTERHRVGLGVTWRP